MLPKNRNILTASIGAGSLTGVTGMGIYTANVESTAKEKTVLEKKINILEGEKQEVSDKFDNIESWFFSTNSFWKTMNEKWCKTEYHYCSGLKTLMEEGEKRFKE